MLLSVELHTAVIAQLALALLLCQSHSANYITVTSNDSAGCKKNYLAFSKCPFIRSTTWIKGVENTEKRNTCPKLQLSPHLTSTQNPPNPSSPASSPCSHCPTSPPSTRCSSWKFGFNYSVMSWEVEETVWCSLYLSELSIHQGHEYAMTCLWVSRMLCGNQTAVISAY